MRHQSAFSVCLFIVFLMASSASSDAASFSSNWPDSMQRPWAGADYWTNPLPDWRVNEGRLECWRGGNDRNVYLLTRRPGAQDGKLTMQVNLGRLEPGGGQLDRGWTGFRVGVQGEFGDYRDEVVYGVGMPVGITTDGRLFIGDPEEGKAGLQGKLDNLTLRLEAEPSKGKYKVRLEALDTNGKSLARIERKDIYPGWLEGSVALVCSRNACNKADWSSPRKPIGGNIDSYPLGRGQGGNVLFWFRDWKVSGDKVVAHDKRSWGPILFAYHTLSRDVMKLTAQLAPVGNNSRTAILEIGPEERGTRKVVAEEVIDPLARTATFRVPNWDSSRDFYYRISYRDRFTGYVQRYDGIIPADPVNKQELVVAAFTGNNDFGFPHADIVRNVSFHKPDLLVYTGDQIYERTGSYSVLRGDEFRLAALDYLRRWYMWGWEYDELIRRMPSVCLPDDHDVFQGNIWGAGGRAAYKEGMTYSQAQDAGGYSMPPVWVNMIQRTQTAHMPDPWDPTPVEQGISVYYCEMLYGGVSFAIIEDRKFKSSPQKTVPAGEIVNGWPGNPDYDAARDGDVEGAVLLGQRQLDFMEAWAGDWSGGAWFKSVISQTIFANVATLPPPARADDIVPKLRVLEPGEYAKDDMLVQDHDSNGWPQTGRNKALRRMRKAFAVHIAGDQHLGSMIQYGVDQWRDAPFAICVPSVANVWPRRWFPPLQGKNPPRNAPRNMGDYRDGFGNLISVHAVSNPTAVDIEPRWINHRAPGYGIVKFNRNERTVSMANWPRWVDATAPDAKPYPGWPMTVTQLDNYSRKPSGWLPSLTVSGISDPVIRVLNEQSGELVYALRIKGTSFQPMVFGPGPYSVEIGDPDNGTVKLLGKLKPGEKNSAGSLQVDF
jgi:alkaline phosphatase D